MTAKRFEQFSELELESLEFLPEELEAIEKEQVPDLDSTSFQDVAKELEAYFQRYIEVARLEARGGGKGAGKSIKNITSQHKKNQKKWPNVDFNVTKNQAVTLVNQASLSRDRILRDKAKEVITKMKGKGWQVTAGGHSGGLGGGGFNADQRPHITLNAGGKNYHLHYTVKAGKMFLTSITGGDK